MIDVKKASLIMAPILFLSVFWSPLAFLPDTARGSTFYVGGSGPGNYSKIQEAIDNAMPGSIIFVHNGTYYENVIVDKQLSLIGENRNTTTIDGSGANDIVNVTADGVDIFNLTLRASGWHPLYFYAGIRLRSVGSCHIESNTILNSQVGISLSYSSNNEISGNNISSNGDGISLSYSFNNVITRNMVMSNGRGVLLLFSNGNRISSNSFSENRDGIYLRSSAGITISNNTIVDGGIRLEGSFIEGWNTHHVDTLNTVNGKPVHYWRNATGGSIPSNAGQILLANCTDTIVEWQDLSDTNVGIQLAYSSGVVVANSTLSYNDEGVSLWYSRGSNILNNDFSKNGRAITLSYSNNNSILNNDAPKNGYGVYSYSSDDNTISNNTLISSDLDGLILWFSANNIIADNNVSLNSEHGLYIRYSGNNTIARNTLSENKGIGIFLDNSSTNRAYHNTIINNAMQAFDNNETNEWDNGYPFGGNYWSDYSGVDEKSGLNQDSSGGDGIGDAPYDIPGGTNKDRYPIVAFENQPPECTISAPVSNEKISSSHNIAGASSDPDGTIQRVDIRIDDNDWIVVTGTTSWTYEWNTSTVTDGIHTIYARSFDGISWSPEVSVTLIVDNSPQEKVELDWFWIAVVTLAVIAIAVFVALLTIFKKRRMKGKEPTSIEAESPKKERT